MPAPRDPLKLLSAILTGLVLGFFAVLFGQRMLPRQEQGQTAGSRGYRFPASL